MAHYFWIPKELDVDTLLVDYDFTTIRAFHRDNLYYILHLINEIPANNKDTITEDGYVPLNALLLRKWIRDYEKYIKCLMALSVIETDGHYVLNIKSKGYRYCEKYRTGLRRVLVTDLTLVKKLDDWIAENDYARQPTASAGRSSISAVYEPISKWYRSGAIQIEAGAANAYNEQVLADKTKDGSRANWDKKYNHDGTYTLKDPYMQFIAGQRNIENLTTGRYNLHADENVFRLHSTITNCKKELRQFIRLQGQKVVAVDISNSQPTLLTVLLDLGFWENTGALKSSDIPYLNLHNIFIDQQHRTTLIKLLNNVQDNDIARNEVEQLRNIVASGTFYDSFCALLKSKLGIEYDREAVKPMVFTMLFTSNRFIGQPEAAPKRVFRDMFPNIYAVISCIKRKAPANLPTILQRIESYLMYYKIVPAIAISMPDTPIVPIHDSIAVAKGNEAEIEAIIREELGACLGFVPHVKREEWLPVRTAA